MTRFANKARYSICYVVEN